MRRKIDMEIKAGAFLLAGMLMVLGTILMMGGGRSIFQRDYRLYVIVPDAGGLAKGAYVRSGGLKIGRVEEIDFSENYDSVKVTMLVNQAFQPRIHPDSIVKMQTQGVLGDKFLEISGGTAEKGPAKNGDVIEAEQSKDLGALMADGTNAVELLKENLANLKVITSAMAQKNQMAHIMRDLTESSANLKDFTHQMKTGAVMQELNQTMKNLKIVSEKVKNGEGTIGALFNDASLYEDLKQLIGGANRNNVLKFFVRQAVKTSDEAAIKNDESKEKKSGKEPASTKK